MSFLIFDLEDVFLETNKIAAGDDLNVQINNPENHSGHSVYFITVEDGEIPQGHPPKLFGRIKSGSHKTMTIASGSTLYLAASADVKVSVIILSKVSVFGTNLSL